MEYEVGDILMCTVERIAGTIVFVKSDSGFQGSIILSEIAPGRIRNLRDYVVPKKKIVCKILKIAPDGHLYLSLRRVTPKEKKEVMEQIKQEKSYTSVLKSVLGDKVEKVIEEIKKQDNLYDFLQEAKESPSELEKIAGKDASKKIIDILKTQKQKKAILKKEITLTTTNPGGVNLIKDLISKIKDAEVRYISAGKYSIKIEADDLKSADNKFKEILADLEKDSKKLGFDLNKEK